MANEYAIRGVNAAQGSMQVEFSDGSRFNINIPVDPNGNALVGDELASYIKGFMPKPKEVPAINNVADLQAMVVPAEPMTVELTWEDIRHRRDRLLTKCDFVMLPDSPKYPEREVWRKYRQKLRDVTDDYGSPAEVKWPTPPEDWALAI